MASTSELPWDKGKQPDTCQHSGATHELCKSYLEEASAVDIRRIDGWTKMVDVMLVYVAFFTGVLTAFIIETTKGFQPDAGDVTNRILIAIYNNTMNATTPIDLEKYLRLDDDAHKLAVYRNALLYTSLAVSIVISLLATLLKLWVIQHERDVTPSGPLHIRLMKRQESYNGSIIWRLEGCIASLPIMNLIALILFGLFILSLISEKHLAIGSVVGIILEAGLGYIFIASCAGAFISDAPFQSALSDFIKLFFRIFPNNPNLRIKLKGNEYTARFRTLGISLTSMLVVVATAFLIFKRNPYYVNLVYYPTAAMFALAKKGQKKDIQQRLYSLPAWIFFPSAIIFVLYGISISCLRLGRTTLFFAFFFLAIILFGFLTYSITKISETKPATTAAEASAWLLQSSSFFGDPALFRTAIGIAGNSHNVRALLLERLLPLVEPLIFITLGDKVQSIAPQQEAFLQCLQDLIDGIDPSEGNFWRNMAPIPSKALSRELRKMAKTSVCPLMVEDDSSVANRCEHDVGLCPYRRVRTMAECALEKLRLGRDNGFEDEEKQ